MIYRYRTGGGIIPAEVYDAGAALVHWKGKQEVVAVSEDADGEKYFVWKGENIYLCDWASMRLEPHDQAKDGFDEELFHDLFRENNMYDAEFRLEEDKRGRYRIAQLVNKDETGLYKLKLERAGNGTPETKEYYTTDFLERLRNGEIKRI